MSHVQRRYLFMVVCFCLLVLPLAAEADEPAQQGEENRAALVIRSGDDQVDTYCVSFAEPEISGYELLQRAGRDVAISDAGMGVTVCRLDEVGCPAGDCFCQCKGDPCVYWSYWHQREGVWQYAVVGASSYQVQPGAVEGWSWGPGSVTEAIPPPELSFSDICEAVAPATPVAAASGDAATAIADGPTPVAPDPADADAANLSTSPPPPAENGAAIWPYLLFALIVLVLAGTLWLLQRRERTT